MTDGKIIVDRVTGERELQTREYVPKGPVRLTQEEVDESPVLTRAQLNRTPRVSGYIYDADSGVIAGLASDELKASHPAGVPFERTIGGMKQRVVIHP